MSGFSRRWLSPAARSSPSNFNAYTTVMLRSVPPSMTSIPEAHADADPKIDLAAELLRRQSTVRLKAWGTSMLPSVWPGDLLTIQSAACDEVVAGDIILVVRARRFFVHRLVGWRLGQGSLLWVTRGDAMPYDDPPAAASELLGRVTKIRRGNHSFVPSRRVSILHSALAWMLCRWDRFRSLALRIHGAYPQASSLTPAAKADHEQKPVIAALKRYATQNEVHHRIPRPRSHTSHP